MQHDLLEIIKLFHTPMEYLKLNELSNSFNLQENKCFFLFDLLSNKCSYLESSIVNILGYNQKKYLNKGFLFFKATIHPTDFSYLITEIVTLIQISNNQNHIENICISVRIKHKNGNWIKSKINLIYLNKTSQNDKDVLFGFIEKDLNIHDENSMNLFNISSREKEVLKHLAAGNSAKTIAAELFISENTVITHRKNLIQKLQVKNSAELIKKGFELNILI